MASLISGFLSAPSKLDAFNKSVSASLNDFDLRWETPQQKYGSKARGARIIALLKSSIAN